jgi:hypothetical protein
MAGKSAARHSAERQQPEEEQNQRAGDPEQQGAPASDNEEPAAAAGSGMIDQLNQLADLHKQGVLSDGEFTAAKSKLFGT